MATKMNSLDDTIAAISTAPGIAAIAIVRMSGSQSFNIIAKIFRGERDILREPANRAIHGFILNDNGETNEYLDEVIVLKFKSPHSYTGEDLVEVHCHGGMYVVQKILDLMLQNGARLAEPGEFTKRAFLNGKMDLLQAESVADIIHAQTSSSLRLFSNQLQGKLSARLGNLKEKIKKSVSLLELELDFSEEDIQFADRQQLRSTMAALIKEIDGLIRSFRYGRILREGIKTVIIGKPNVGKSSILNRLLEEERAIVSEIPGTTRDSLEELVDIDGLLFRLVDTAGLRDTTNVIEAKGVERTEELIKRADLILAVFEAQMKLSDEDDAILERLSKLDDKEILPLINKADLKERLSSSEVDKISSFGEVLRISALTGGGFLELEKKMVEKALNRNSEYQFINKARHLDALRRARKHLQLAIETMGKNLSAEFISMDVRASLDALGEITGEVTNEEILNDIFSNFCIGK